MIDQKYIDEVLDKVDLAEVAEDYGITLKLKGHRAWACCPFHNEDTASFCIDTAKNLWYCHGCNKGGNVITFVMEKDGLSFPLAVRKLLKEKLISKLLWGSILGLLGISFLVYGLLIDYRGGMNPDDLIRIYFAGGILLAVGIAFLVNYRLSRKMLAKEIEAEEKRVTALQP